ncbi:hypothetical protein SAMN04490243_0973 [Robiginitalea myxolifaciens]|uniref:Uncharacterized protein n=1 Tax=Robiginitalea myxolifaciens TaxID=400055 RepID=A0A1I6FZK2_9FLAO|nr:hypothetical protein [Robiginitalea myxolifaciens]SFR35326.1 hypothetical protein SAMN04490243_0973 [Robiginitalea myxolifaciens]
MIQIRYNKRMYYKHAVLDLSFLLLAAYVLLYVAMRGLAGPLFKD